MEGSSPARSRSKRSRERSTRSSGSTECRQRKAAGTGEAGDQARALGGAGGGMLAVDFFSGGMNLGGDVDAEATKLAPPDRALAEAYCDGVNQALRRRLPWELRLLRHRPEPWSVGDSILISRLVGYVALAQSQADMERLLIEMVHAGVAA